MYLIKSKQVLCTTYLGVAFGSLNPSSKKIAWNILEIVIISRNLFAADEFTTKNSRFCRKITRFTSVLCVLWIIQFGFNRFWLEFESLKLTTSGWLECMNLATNIFNLMKFCGINQLGRSKVKKKSSIHRFINKSGLNLLLFYFFFSSHLQNFTQWSLQLFNKNVFRRFGMSEQKCRQFNCQKRFDPLNRDQAF